MLPLPACTHLQMVKDVSFLVFLTICANIHLSDEEKMQFIRESNILPIRECLVSPLTLDWFQYASAADPDIQLNRKHMEFFLNIIELSL